MSELRFKIGDPVRVTDRRCKYADQAGVIRYIEGDDFPFGVGGLPDFNGIVWCRENELTFADQIEAGTEHGDAVNHPGHYGGADNPYEVIKVAEAWGLDKDAYLFNVLKYIGRADKKGATLQDHKKARFYLDRKIKQLEAEQ